MRTPHMVSIQCLLHELSKSATRRRLLILRSRMKLKRRNLDSDRKSPIDILNRRHRSSLGLPLYAAVDLAGARLSWKIDKTQKKCPRRRAHGLSLPGMNAVRNQHYIVFSFAYLKRSLNPPQDFGWRDKQIESSTYAFPLGAFVSST